MIAFSGVMYRCQLVCKIYLLVQKLCYKYRHVDKIKT